MKVKLSKIFALVLCVILTLSMCTVTLAQSAPTAQTPVFDETFDSGKGGFFANGTPVVISQIDGKTVVNWSGGSVEISPTTKVFGGGIAETSFYETKIKMEGGTVAGLYGGGFSTDPLKPAIVGKSEVIIDGGNVSASAYAGGLLYSRVSDANITINDGIAQFLLGGGAASATIDGVSYNTGTETAPQDSGTVVENAKVTVNGGIPSYVFGGGQGYSNTDKTSVLISGGEILYVTAGGSNGLTGEVNVAINGGTIGLFHSVNRGTINDADVKMNGGFVETFYIGSEDALDATGKIDKATVNIVGGNVGSLNAGKNNNVPLVITKPVFDVVYVDGIIGVKNITGDATPITAKIYLSQKNIELARGGRVKVKYNVVTTPSGYDNLFANVPIVWSCADENIVVIQNGIVNGINEGTTIICATLNSESDIAEAKVLNVDVLFIMIVLLIFFAVIIIIIIITALYRRSRN